MRTLLLNIRNRTRQQLARLDTIKFYNRKIPGRTDTFCGGNMEIGKNPRKTVTNGQRISAVALTFFHRLCMVVGRLICKFIFGDKGQAMPAINDLILTESATSIAAKIRTQKVSTLN